MSTDAQVPSELSGTAGTDAVSASALSLQIADMVILDGETTITVKDGHTLVHKNIETGQCEYPLSEAEIRDLNTLYGAVTDFSNRPDIEPVSDTVFITHDGVVDGYQYGGAAQPELDQFIYWLCRYCCDREALLSFNSADYEEKIAAFTESRTLDAIDSVGRAHFAAHDLWAEYFATVEGAVYYEDTFTNIFAMDTTVAYDEANDCWLVSSATAHTAGSPRALLKANGQVLAVWLEPVL